MNFAHMIRQRGFSLIELMIAVAIVSILAVVAYPSYQDYIRKGKRADAAASLSSAAQWMERNFSDSARYDRLPSGAAIALPSNMATVPEGSAAANKYYDVTISAVGQTTYTLQAAPVNSMTGDACGSFTLTQTGAKGLTGNSKPVLECWRR